MKRKNMAVASLALLLTITGCTNQSISQSDTASFTESASQEKTGQEAASQEVAKRDIFAMDTYMTISVFGENGEQAADAAETEILRLDALLSTGDEDSEISALNRQGGGSLSEDASVLMERSLEIAKSTNGAFNPAIYPLMELWGFPSGSYHVPDEAELAEAKARTDMNLLSYDAASKALSFGREDMAIDFGGIAKGYTSSRIMEIFREQGIESAMINLGGNVQVLGNKPDGSAWRVAIQSPDEETQYLGILEISDKAVITSGGYERYFEEDGVRYHHIIDPATGRPANSGLTSVTIVSSDGTLADGLSTSLFIMGRDEAIAYWRAHRDEFDAILLDENQKLWITENIADLFSSDLETEVIR